MPLRFPDNEHIAGIQDIVRAFAADVKPALQIINDAVRNNQAAAFPESGRTVLKGERIIGICCGLIIIIISKERKTISISKFVHKIVLPGETLKRQGAENCAAADSGLLFLNKKEK